MYCAPQYLRKLRLPALLHLSINESSTGSPMKTGGDSLISLPALEILKVVANTSSSWLAILSAPYIRVFTLRHIGRGPRGGFSLFRNIHFPAVQDLSLDYPCTCQVAISALECVPNAGKVAVSSSLHGEPWGLKILRRVADAENMLCPNITHFTLGSPSNRAGVNKTSAKACAQRAIKNRMDGGVRMNHFEIHFKAHQETIQYA